MARNFRNNNQQAIDQGEVANQSYNEAAGAKKVMIVGGKLKPFCVVPDTTYTTDFSTRRLVGKGVSLAFYNNSGAVASVTLGDSTVTSLVAGVANAAGYVGVPVPANSWVYLNTYDIDHAITSVATCMGFIIEDDTSISTRS